MHTASDICILPRDAYCLGMHTASGCILPRDAYCLGYMHTASGCIRPRDAFSRKSKSNVRICEACRLQKIARSILISARMHPEAVCIPRQYAYIRGSMHPEAECNQGRIQPSPNTTKPEYNQARKTPKSKKSTKSTFNKWVLLRISVRIRCPIPNCPKSHIRHNKTNKDFKFCLLPLDTLG